MKWCCILHAVVNTFCFLLNLILGALSSKLHLVSSTNEGPQKQEQLENWEQKMKIVESEKIKGEQKNSHCLKYS